MSLLDKLERRFRPFAIPNVTLFLVIGQSIFFVIGLVQPGIIEQMFLVPELVLQGEIWRLVTFIFLPPRTNPIFAAFALYILYVMGTALETHWGEFRYNVYLLIAILLTIAVAWLVPGSIGTNFYITVSIFLAFAYLYPDFEILLFFILPVKMKWLAYIAWAGLLLAFLFGDWATRWYIQAAVANFFIFFGNDLRHRLKNRGRRMARQAAARAEADRPLHRCEVCGITEKTNPDEDFRYCPACTGGKCYCSEHIFAHSHS